MDIRYVAIGGLSLLESVAMITGNDGKYFLPIVAVIAGLGGYTYCEYKHKGCRGK
ncbi:MAG: hypothetical protein ABR999_09040 [Methanoregula sp.]|jgi:hypothetical protein|uniref:hypothetical protein n=1 Tax=Methanoregula sp. TaxID=2052170 RepID=UPI003D0B5529